MRMDHQQAIATHAVERYLLDELTGPKRDEFEDHFFECAECADAVRNGSLLAANARAVLEDEAKAKAAEDSSRPPLPGRIVEIPVRPGVWFQRMAGAIAATVVIGTSAALYLQANPDAKRETPQVQAANTVNSSVRRWKLDGQRRGNDDAQLTIKLELGKIEVLDLELPEMKPLPAYRVEIHNNQTGSTVLTDEDAPTHDGTISIPLPPNLSPGNYKVVVVGPESIPLTTDSFTLVR